MLNKKKIATLVTCDKFAQTIQTFSSRTIIERRDGGEPRPCPYQTNPGCRRCRSVVGKEDNDILNRGGRKHSMARKSNARVSALNSGKCLMRDAN